MTGFKYRTQPKETTENIELAVLSEINRTFYWLEKTVCL